MFKLRSLWRYRGYSTKAGMANLVRINLLREFLLEELQLFFHWQTSFFQELTVLPEQQFIIPFSRQADNSMKMLIPVQNLEIGQFQWKVRLWVFYSMGSLVYLYSDEIIQEDSLFLTVWLHIWGDDFCEVSCGFPSYRVDRTCRRVRPAAPCEWLPSNLPRIAGSCACVWTALVTRRRRTQFTWPLAQPIRRVVAADDSPRKWQPDCGRLPENNHSFNW